MPVRQHTYPAFIELRNRRVLVIGDGQRAVRKIKRLISEKPNLQLICQHADHTLQRLCDEHRISMTLRSWTKQDLEGNLLVFAACESDAENLSISQAADQTGCLVNVADQPEKSSFLVPSLIDRHPLMIAVSSGGSTPVLARLVSARIEALIPDTYRHLASLAQRYASRIAGTIQDRRLRTRFWEYLLSGRVGESILQGRVEDAENSLCKALESRPPMLSGGEVYLVGAGPGDPDLLSFRAVRLMQQCDIVLYDRLVSEQIMALVNPEAEKVYVGKRRDDHVLAQESINHQLARLAREGHRVLRLKGGDPFMFGRGGEEIETLAEAGMPFQVVPGITAAGGCASYAGIPLTHRDHAQSCLFVTGHLQDGTVNLDWPALARKRQTVVVYMGLLGLATICRKLIEQGLPAEHPVALVAQGTRVQQQVITGTLADMPERISTMAIKPPTLIIIGTVVSLHNKLSWFEQRR